eukprot:16259402-Heterocapsa_arctica.AAC.1
MGRSCSYMSYTVGCYPGARLPAALLSPCSRPQCPPDPGPHHALVQRLSQIMPDAEDVVLHGHRLALAVCQR